MKTKRIIAAAAALMLSAWASAPVFNRIPDAEVITASAAEDKEITEGVLTYRINGENATIVSCDKDAEGELIIPERLSDYYDITGIADQAFKECTSLTSVEMSDFIREIGKDAFSGCTALVSAKLPPYIPEVPEGMFRGCKNLKEAEIPECVYREIKAIGEEAFYGCISLDEIVLPDGIETIGDRAFEGCTNLAYIDEPETLISVGQDAFKDTMWLEESTKSGHVILNDILLAGQKSESVADLSYDSVRRIASGAYSGCEELTEIHLPFTLEKIDANAFDGCTNLKKVYFNGFEIQWDSLRHYSDMEGNEAVFGTDDITFGDTPMLQYGCFTVRIDGLEYTVTSTEAWVRQIYDETKGDIVIPPEVNGVPVTCIREYAFSMNEDITSVTIPDSVTKIEDSAFKGCTGLTEITVPDSVRFIGDEVFADCSSLAQIKMPAYALHIGNGIFTGTKMYESNRDIGGFVVIDGELVESSADSGDIVIPDTVKKIGDGVFAYSDITSVRIPGSVTEIGENAFFRCRQLTDAVIAEGVEKIGESAFEGTALTEITLPDSLTDIGRGVFDNTSIKKLTIPRGLKDIFNLLNENESIEEVEILSEIDSVEIAIFRDCKALRRVKLPDSVKIIESNAFNGCRNLSDFEIPSGVYEIGPAAFQFCRSLTSVKIPEGVSEISSDAFSKCYELREIYIPAGMGSIYPRAFEYCDKLSDVYFGGTEERWNQIRQYSSPEGNEDLFVNARVHFNSAAPAAGLSGDANEDGKITVSDAVAVLQYIANAEKYALSEQGIKNADCDGTAGITGGDAIMIQKMDAGVN